MNAFPLPSLAYIQDELANVSRSILGQSVILGIRWERGPPNDRFYSHLLLELPPGNYATRIQGVRIYRGRTVESRPVSIRLAEYRKPIRNGLGMIDINGERFAVLIIPDFELHDATLVAKKGT